MGDRLQFQRKKRDSVQERQSLDAPNPFPRSNKCGLIDRASATQTERCDSEAFWEKMNGLS